MIFLTQLQQTVQISPVTEVSHPHFNNQYKIHKKSNKKTGLLYNMKSAQRLGFSYEFWLGFEMRYLFELREGLTMSGSSFSKSRGSSMDAMCWASARLPLLLVSRRSNTGRDWESDRSARSSGFRRKGKLAGGGGVGRLACARVQVEPKLSRRKIMDGARRIRVRNLEFEF